MNKLIATLVAATFAMGAAFAQAATPSASADQVIASAPHHAKHKKAHKKVKHHKRHKHHKNHKKAAAK